VDAGPAVAVAIGIGMIWTMMILAIIAAYRFRDR